MITLRAHRRFASSNLVRAQEKTKNVSLRCCVWTFMNITCARVKVWPKNLFRSRKLSAMEIAIFVMSTRHVSPKQSRSRRASPCQPKHNFVKPWNNCLTHGLSPALQMFIWSRFFFSIKNHIWCSHDRCSLMTDKKRPCSMIEWTTK